jgi:hypothetical protein
MTFLFRYSLAPAPKQRVDFAEKELRRETGESTFLLREARVFYILAFTITKKVMQITNHFMDDG